MLRTFLLTALLAFPFKLFADDCGGKNLLLELPEAEFTLINQKAAQVPYGKGLLWEARKSGQRITFFGSYHLPHAFTQSHLTSLLPRARAADVAYFEINSEDTKTFERDVASKPDFMFLSSGPTLLEMLGEDDWATLSEKMSARGFPPFMVAKMKPIFASMMLGMTPCKMQLMQQGAHGIDRLLADTLASEGAQTRSIEHYTTAAKLFDVYPLAEQVEMLRLSLLEPISSDDMAETLFLTYLAQDIGLFWEYTRHVSLKYGGDTAQEDFAIFEELLLTNRNNAWVKKLQAATEQNIFVTVGAAHLPGKIGVLNLLAQAGYEIIPLPFTN